MPHATKEKRLIKKAAAFGRRFETLLLNHNEAAACRLHREAFDAMFGEPDEPLGKMLLANVVSERAANMLENVGIVFVEDLVGRKSEELLAIPSFGPVQFDEVWQRVLVEALDRDPLAPPEDDD